MLTTRNSAFLHWANLAAYLVMVAINVMANVASLNGKTTGAISDAFPTLFAPAGYVFSIWGVIYLLLLVFVAYQLLPSNRGKASVQRIGYMFVLSCIANVSWLFLWHYLQIVLSVVPMFILLGCLVVIYLRLGKSQSEVPLKEQIALDLPFSVYLGWITVASIADVAAALVSIGWNGWGISDPLWTDLMILVALVVTIGIIITRRDVAYGLVIIWALIGIIVKQAAQPSIVMTAGASVFIILVAMVLAFLGVFKRFSIEKAAEAQIAKRA